jgi:hypothetical protein
MQKSAHSARSPPPKEISGDVRLADQFFTDGLLHWLADCGQQSLDLT